MVTSVVFVLFIFYFTFYLEIILSFLLNSLSFRSFVCYFIDTVWPFLFLQFLWLRFSLVPISGRRGRHHVRGGAHGVVAFGHSPTITWPITWHYRRPFVFVDITNRSLLLASTTALHWIIQCSSVRHSTARPLHRLATITFLSHALLFSPIHLWGGCIL